MRAVELYYTPAEIALLLRLHGKTVVRKLAAKEFGDGVVNLGGELRPLYRVPASAVNAYLDARRIFRERDLPEPGLRACSRRELERTAAREHPNRQG